MEYRIELAGEEQAGEVLALYRSLIGREGCAWSLDYPSAEDVAQDIRERSLYVVLGEEIVAAAFAGRDGELDRLTCFRGDIRTPCDLARIGVRADCQNRGIAQRLIGHVEAEAVRRGFDGMRLLVSKTNPHARAVYDKLGYQRRGECTMYDNDWYCYDKKLI